MLCLYSSTEELKIKLVILVQITIMEAQLHSYNLP